MSGPSRVSILIPVYNCEAWVGAAIESALCQTWPDKEVVVFDDGSTDRTLDVIRGFGTAVRYCSARLGGQNVTRNRLFHMSDGEWLVFLDADDTLAPDSIEKKMACTQDAEAVYGSIEIARYHGQQKMASFVEPAITDIDLWVALFGWRLPNTSATMLKRTAVLAAGGWNETIQNCTDYGLYFAIAMAGGRFRAAPDSMSLYRHWNPKQASYENNIRLITTRLDLMLNGIRFLKQTDVATPERLNAWANYTLNCLRALDRQDQSRIDEFLRYLKDIHPGYRPGSPAFSLLYASAFDLLGFRAAQQLAAATRKLRKTFGLTPKSDTYYLPNDDLVQG